MQTNITIRKTTSTDLPAILDLWKELMDYHSNLDPFYTRSKDGHTNFLEWIQKESQNDSSEILVAEKSGKLLGYIKIGIFNYPPVFEIKNCGMISDLAVATEYRRQGIGALLYQEAMKWFKDKNLKRVELRAATVNPVSQNFWKKMGFTPYLTSMFKEN